MRFSTALALCKSAALELCKNSLFLRVVEDRKLLRMQHLTCALVVAGSHTLKDVRFYRHSKDVFILEFSKLLCLQVPLLAPSLH